MSDPPKCYTEPPKCSTAMCLFRSSYVEFHKYIDTYLESLSLEKNGLDSLRLMKDLLKPDDKDLWNGPEHIIRQQFSKVKTVADIVFKCVHAYVPGYHKMWPSSRAKCFIGKLVVADVMLNWPRHGKNINRSQCERCLLRSHRICKPKPTTLGLPPAFPMANRGVDSGNNDGNKDGNKDDPFEKLYELCEKLLTAHGYGGCDLCRGKETSCAT